MAKLRSFAAATALVLTWPSMGALAQQTVTSQDEQVVLIADNVYENRTDNSMVAEGNVEASYQGRILRADKVVYNRTTDKIRATGNVVIIDPDGTERFSDEVEVSSSLADGYAVGFSVRLPNGGRAVASRAIRQDDGINALDNVIYTACEVCGPEDSPTWALRARRAVLDEEDKMISYRDAVLEIAGVPVLYLPFFAHPDPNSGRRSGLLPPDFGLSSKVGLFYQQPYYWAISDHSELTIAPEVFQDVNPLLELTYSKRFWSGQLNINTSVTQERLFDGDGNRLPESDKSVRSHVFADGLFSISKDWQWGFGLERASDDLFLRRYDIDGEGDLRGLYVSQPRRLISQLFLVGQNETFYSETAFLGFQGLRENDENSEIPIVTPLIHTEKLLDLNGFGQAAISASTAILNRDEGVDSQRISVGGDWSNQHILPGGFALEPFADARFDYYGLDKDISGEDNVTRTLASGGAKLSYPMIRPGRNVDILIEPQVMGAWGVSNANKDEIPNEDSLLFEFSEASLFDSNGFAGHDLYEGDGRAAAGFTATARWKNGVELSGIGGKRWRWRSDPNFDALSNLDGTTSDYVAGTRLDLGRPLAIEAGMRFDDESFKLNRIDARLRTNVWRFSGNAQYFRLEDSITPSGNREEGIVLGSKFQLSKRYSLVYSRQRDIEQKIDRTEGLGIQYEDDCSRFQLVYQRQGSTDRELGPSESIMFVFSLRTLGEFGSSDVD